MQSPTIKILKSTTIPCGNVCHYSTQKSLEFSVFAKAHFNIHSPTCTKSDGSSSMLQLCIEEEIPVLTLTHFIFQ